MALPFHVEQPIAATPDAVWSYLTHFENTRHWMEGTTEVEELTPPPIRAGSRYRQTRSIGRHVATVELEVRAIDAAARTILLEADGRRSALGRGVFRFGYAVLPAPGGSARLVLDGEIDALGRAVELVASFFVGNFTRVVARDLDALRSRVEEQRAPREEHARGAEALPREAAAGPIEHDGRAPGVTTSSTSRVPST